MKSPLYASGLSLGWLAQGSVVSDWGTGPSAGHLRHDLACCPQEPEDDFNPDSWEDQWVRFGPYDVLPYEEPWLTEPSERGEHLADSANVAWRSADATKEELAALKSELAQMKEARTVEQRELGELRERLHTLECKFDDLLAMQDFDAEDAPVDPHARWIQQNFDELRKYPDRFVALDPERGILIHATEQSDFAAKLETLSPEDNERVMLLHTSMYLRG